MNKTIFDENKKHIDMYCEGSTDEVKRIFRKFLEEIPKFGEVKLKTFIKYPSFYVEGRLVGVECQKYRVKLHLTSEDTKYAGKFEELRGVMYPQKGREEWAFIDIENERQVKSALEVIRNAYHMRKSSRNDIRTHKEELLKRSLRKDALYKKSEIIEDSEKFIQEIIIKDDSWERWKRDVEEFKTTVPCEGQKYRWLIGYLGNPTSKIMFISEIPNLSERFTKKQPAESTDENLQWNVHEGDWLFREMLFEFGFKTNSPREAGGWNCWITDIAKCPMEDKKWKALDSKKKSSIIRKSIRLLEREIKLLDPVLIVTIGNNADKEYNDYIKTNPSISSDIRAISKEKMTHYSYIMLRPTRSGRRAGDPERIEEYQEEFRRIKQRYEEEIKKRYINKPIEYFNFS